LLDALGPDARPFVAALAASSHRSIATSARRLLAAIPAEPAQSLQINVLGPLELCWDGQLANPRELRRERVRQLLGYLVDHRKATRQAIIAALWPDLDDQAAQNNLRVTLSYLVRSLEPDRLDGEASFFVRQDQDTLCLEGEPQLSVDAWDFERHLDEAAIAERHGTPSLALAALLSGVALWRGPYLLDAGAEWSELESERLRLRYLDASTRAGELLLATGDTTEPEGLAQEVLRLEPWSERAYRLLAATHLARGDRPAAQHTLARCAAMLIDLGVDPEPETSILERRAGAQPNRR
jgi:DNA-binding SARP family transcriptional activator